MTIYHIDTVYVRCKHPNGARTTDDLCNDCLPNVGFVGLERCKHTDDLFPLGHIDGHWIGNRQGRGHESPWCSGAGIGDKHE